jgi:hypothetical protein
MSVKQWEGPVLAVLTGRFNTLNEADSGQFGTYHKYTWVEVEIDPSGKLRKAKPARQGTRYCNYAVEIGNNKVGVPTQSDSESVPAIMSGPVVMLYGMYNSGGNLIYFFQYNPLLVSTSLYHRVGGEIVGPPYGQDVSAESVQEVFNTTNSAIAVKAATSNLLLFKRPAYVNTYNYANNWTFQPYTSVDFLPAMGGDPSVTDGSDTHYPGRFNGIVTDFNQYWRGNKQFDRVISTGVGIGTPLTPGTGESTYERMVEIYNISNDNPAKIYFYYRNVSGYKGLYAGDLVDIFGVLGIPSLNGGSPGKARYTVDTITTVSSGYSYYVTLKDFYNNPLNGSTLPKYQGGGYLYRTGGTVDASIPTNTYIDTGVHLTGVNTELVGECFISKSKQGTLQFKSSNSLAHIMSTSVSGPFVGLSAQPTTNIHTGEAAVWAYNYSSSTPRVDFRSTSGASITSAASNNTASFAVTSGDGVHQFGVSGDNYYIYGVTRNYSDNTNTNGGTGVTVKTSTGMKFYGGIYIGGASQAVTVSGYMGL